jgi:transposase
MYHDYTPDQAYLLPPSLHDLITPDDPVRMVVSTLARLDFSAFDRVYAAERGRPPFHPRMMAGLFLYGVMRGIYSSRKLAAASQRDVSFIYVAGRATPDFHTVAEFRQRFREELKGLFLQVLGVCREAGPRAVRPRQPGWHEAARQRVETQGDELRADTHEGAGPGGGGARLAPRRRTPG